MGVGFVKRLLSGAEACGGNDAGAGAGPGPACLFCPACKLPIEGTGATSGGSAGARASNAAWEEASAGAAAGAAEPAPYTCRRSHPQDLL